jgi:leucyl aminopeptidase
MNIKTVQGLIETSTADTFIVSLFEDTPIDKADGSIQAINAALTGAVAELIEGGDFNGKAGQVAVLYPHGALNARRVILVGLGKKDELTIESVRRAAAYAIKRADSLRAKYVATVLHGVEAGQFSVEITSQAIVEASGLALYHYRGQKSQKSNDNAESTIETLEIITSNKSEEISISRGIDAGKAIIEGVTITRDLVNLPPNYCTPAYMASVARQVAQETGSTVQILEKSQMEALRMGALLAVAQGSATPPCFIILEHNANRADELDTIVLVGKGVTFDTGGYSIKTFEGMSTMKSDMAGGAAVIGAMKTIALLNISLRVVGLVPAADNMISGNAFRPQEVVTASNGVTIEIVSTDAEGRMLLADALVYASRYKPAAVVDIATLTGACFVALGGQASGLFSTDDRLRDMLVNAGAITQERVWALPMYPEYKKVIESETADLKNSAGKPGGGASVAALFLKNFIDYPAWAHVDMAGLAGSDGENPYQPKGASGYGVRLFIEFVQQWANAKS